MLTENFQDYSLACLQADKVRQTAYFLLKIGSYFCKLTHLDKEKQNFISIVKQTINFYEFKDFSKGEWLYFEQLQVFLEFLYNEETAVELFIKMYRKLMLIRSELERECKSLLFVCLTNFSIKLNSSELMDLVFEEW